jgi:hypothetical protein
MDIDNAQVQALVQSEDTQGLLVAVGSLLEEARSRCHRAAAGGSTRSAAAHTDLTLALRAVGRAEHRL